MKRSYPNMKSRFEYEEYYIDDLYNAYLTHEDDEEFDDFVDLCYHYYRESFNDSLDYDTETYFLGKFL